MNYRRIPPSRDLARYIDFHEVVEGHIPDPNFAFINFNHPTEQGISIFFRLNGQGSHHHFGKNKEELYQEGQVYIQSVSTKGSAHRVCGRIGYLRTFFKPGKLNLFLGIPLHQATDHLLTLEDLEIKEHQYLEEQIMESSNMQDRIRHLERFLRRRLRWISPRIELAQQLAEITRRGGILLTVEELSENWSYSSRHLQRIFRDQIGVGPKKFLKIYRVKKVVDAMESGTFSNLTQLAYQYHFSDQAHFSREFKKVMGAKPKKFLQQVDQSFTHRTQLNLKGLLGEFRQ
jgi:AraC-like DNA-binding protein